MSSSQASWSRAGKDVATSLVLPWRFIFRFSRPQNRSEAPILLELRVLTLTFMVSLGLFLFVMSFLDLEPVGSAIGFTVATVVVGVLSLTFVVWPLPKRRLDSASTRRFVESYREMYFLGFAVSEVPALVGFVGAFQTGRLWVFVVGMLFGLVGLVLSAPSDNNLDRMQRRLRERGAPLSVREVLMLRWAELADGMRD